MIIEKGSACRKMMKGGAVTIFYRGQSCQSSEQAPLVAQKGTDVPSSKTLTEEFQAVCPF